MNTPSTRIAPAMSGDFGDALGQDSGALGGRLAEGTYIELVRSLFTPVVPTTIMTLNFLAAGLYIVRQTQDDILLYLYALCALASVLRMGVLFRFRRSAQADGFDAPTARRVERTYAIAYIGFALVFGIFAARAFGIASPTAHILLMALLYGYGAGVAAGISLRPWISIPSMLVAIVPTIVVSLAMPGFPSWGTGLLTIFFLAGGIESLLRRYRATSKQISMHRLLTTMAWRDELTGLPNRLLLRERFDRMRGGSGDADQVAVHRIDLTRLKQVNESHGHPFGDELLKAVAERLNRTARAASFAVRLSADDFIVVQSEMTKPRDAEILARQIIAAVGKPYAIGAQTISIGLTVGYAFAPRRSADLDNEKIFIRIRFDSDRVQKTCYAF